MLRWRVVDEQGRILVNGTKPLAGLTQVVSVTGELPAGTPGGGRYRLSVKLQSPISTSAETTLEWPMTN